MSIPEPPQNDVDAYCQENAERFVSELIEILRIPSISADPGHARDVRRSADHLARAAAAAGMTSVAVVETEGHPAVLAERMVDDRLPTVLIYGHHDVQPVDPLAEWTSPPFDPAIRDGRLYGRGAVDDKGQVWMHLKAVEAHVAVRGDLPVNLRMIVEGEEEIGSPHFEELVERERQRLTADLVVVSDTAMVAREVPSLCTGLRGLALVEVEVEGPRIDLHSGVFGGAVPNPVAALCRMIAALHDPDSGRVTVPGFYDDVLAVPDSDRALLAAVPFDEAAFRAQAGDIEAVAGEIGWTVNERRSIRPTLEVNGIWGGYAGPGSKTIVPARAGCKISCRLVPDQDPMRVARAVADAVRASAPAGVHVRAVAEPGGRPVVTATDHPGVRAAGRALARVFGAEPVLTREGGSIPPVEVFKRVLGLDTVLVGVGLPDDQIHAPNEKFDLEQFHRGIRVLAHLWDEVAVTPGIMRR